jgi:hypothetical protein
VQSSMEKIYNFKYLSCILNPMNRSSNIELEFEKEYKENHSCISGKNTQEYILKATTATVN